MIDTEKIASELKNSYISMQLKNIYKIYLVSFDKKKYESGLADSYILKLMVKVFSDEVLFQKFFDSLEKGFRDIMYYLIWESETVSQSELLNDFQTDIKTKFKALYHVYDYIENINPKFHLFNIEKGYNPIIYDSFVVLSIPDILKKLVRPFFKNKPYGYNLHFCQNCLETEYLYENNSHIINDLSLYFKFFEKKKEYSDISLFDTPNIVKNDLKFLLNISKDKKEFFNLKGHELIKNSILAAFIIFFFKNYQESKLNNLELLKELITKFESSPFFLTTNLLFDIGGKNSLSNEKSGLIVRNRTFIKSMFYVFREFKPDKWYAFKDILQFIYLRDLDTDILGKADLSKLYIAYTDEYGKKEKKLFSRKHDYKDLFVVPLIKAFFFLFGALGVFDIKYNSSTDQLGSVFQGLIYVKLTNLGAHLLGLKENFEYKTEENNTKIIIEDTELTIKIKGVDKTKTMFLPSFAEQVSPNMYIVNYSSFLKNCNSKKDIEEKISLFKKEFSENPSEIWTDFFGKALKRFSPFRQEKELVCFKVTPDKELLDLLVNDSVIKTFVIKMEGARIAIYKDNLPKVKKRLEQFGYLIGSLEQD
jgi:hypothetical protein